MTQSIKPQSINQLSHVKSAIAGVIILTAVSFAGLSVANLAFATEPTAAISAVDQTQSGTFEKSAFTIKGEWQILEEDGQRIFRLSEDFKTKNGPDLKLFLSPDTVETAKGETVTANSVRLGVLRTNRGSQDYVIPADVDLSEYGSILIHCEAFSKLWGGANL